MPASVERLRNALMEALKRESVDFDRVAALSRQLLALDPQSVRFSVDASHISRLGLELVAKQETAVAELVKNAYDADATYVTLTFDAAHRAGGTLTIVDDGNGMTREELVAGFMRLSSQVKVTQPLSPRFGRRRAGRKGIGRFATQRLGTRLTVITQTSEASTALRLSIDWADFEAGAELTQVGSRVREAPRASTSGTTLVMGDLRDAWTDAELRRAYRMLADLLQPFPLGQKRPAGTSREPDPGFHVTIRRARGGTVLNVVDEESAILRHALAVIDGSVDSSGKIWWGVRSDRLNLNEPKIPLRLEGSAGQATSPGLKGVRMRAWYFIFRAEFLPPKLRKSVNALAEARGGIRLYRNGFRVPPYGDRDNDWLGVDELARSRTFLPPFGNKNFFGFIELHDPEGHRFEETSSREGLIENDEFRALQKFGLAILRAGAQRVAEARGTKVTTRGRVSPERRLQRAAAQLRRLAREQAAARSVPPGIQPTEDGVTADRRVGSAGLALGNGLAERLERLAEEVANASQEQAALTAVQLEELGMLRVLASLGLTIGEFTHEVRQYLPLLEADATSLVSSSAVAASPTAERILTNVRAVKSFAAYFDRAIAENASRELRPLDLRDVVNDFVDTIRPDLHRSGVKLHGPTFTATRLVTLPMHPSEWPSLLFNLFTNAKKAIARARREGELLIRAGRSDSICWLEFADNGDGIPPEDADRIFNAFFTTATVARDDTGPSRIVGSGLGLKIVRDIVTGYGGSVRLVDPPTNFSTCFRIEVPVARPEHLVSFEY